MSDFNLDARHAELAAEAKRINAGRKPKFGDLMRNPWAGETNPHRDGYFVREGKNGGRLNPGRWYEFTDRKGEFWQVPTDCVFFVGDLSASEPAVDRKPDFSKFATLDEYNAAITKWNGARKSSVDALAARLQKMGVTRFGFTPGDNATPEKVAAEIMRVLDEIEVLATPAAPEVPQDSSMPVDMSQAKRWITQLRGRVDSLLAIINAAPEVPAPAARPVLSKFATLEDYQAAKARFDGVQGAQAQPEPVPEMSDVCGCRACNPAMVGRWFFVCATCGNKRCPHANDHRNVCTNSNEVGQKGSAYENQGRATTSKSIEGGAHGEG